MTLARIIVSDVIPRNGDRSARGRTQPRNRIHQFRLPVALHTSDADDLAGPHHETDAIDDRTTVLVMSHTFLRDKDYVRALLPTPARSIHLLGPATRTGRLLAELRDEGITPRDEDLARIYYPTGLDVGYEGPEEIAAAIVAEIIAVRRGRRGGFLKERLGPIHEREPAARARA